MSRIVFIAAILLVLVSFSYAQDFDGKWIGQMQGPEGSMDLFFTFKAAGDTLTGAVESAMGEIPFSNGKINGNNFSFDISFGEMVISHQCVFMKDSISMKVPGMQGETTEMFLKRVPESKK